MIRRIVSENPSCVMLKHEDWPGLEKITTLRGFERDGSMRHIAILTGNGGLFLDFEMERGADGANTGYAFPEMLVDVVRLSAAGQRDAAHDLFDAHLPYLRYEQQQGPLGLAVRKYVLKRRGSWPRTRSASRLSRSRLRQSKRSTTCCRASPASTGARRSRLDRLLPHRCAPGRSRNSRRRSWRVA